MRQRIWLLHGAALLAALCCGLHDAAAKPSTTATVSPSRLTNIYQRYFQLQLTAFAPRALAEMRQNS